jgi:hypothetical protein
MGVILRLTPPFGAGRPGLPVHPDHLLGLKKKFWAELGEDPGGDPAVAALGRPDCVPFAGRASRMKLTIQPDRVILGRAA